MDNVIQFKPKIQSSERGTVTDVTEFSEYLKDGGLISMTVEAAKINGRGLLFTCDPKLVMALCVMALDSPHCGVNELDFDAVFPNLAGETNE